LWQAKGWILGIFGIVFGLSLPAIWLLSKPSFRAAALARVSPKALRIAFKNEENSGVAFYKTFVNTQVSLLRGPTVLQRVLDRDDVRGTDWFRHPQRSGWGASRSPLERLTRDVTVRPLRDSELIEVAVYADRAADARVLANATVDEYKKYSDETLREADVHRFDALVEEHSRLQKEIDGLLKTKFSVAKQLGTASPEELRSQLTTHLSRLEEQYAELKRNLALTDADREWLIERESEVADEASQPGQDGSTDAVHSLRYARDVEWRRLRMNLEEVKHAADLARNQFGDEHPRIKELQSKVDHAQRLLAERERQLDDPGQSLVAEGQAGSAGAPWLQDPVLLERQAQRLQQQLALLGKEIEQQRTRVAQAGDLAADLAQYDEQIRRKRELGETLHSRLAELELEGKAPARISIEAHAVEPTRPDRDPRWMLSGLAFAVAAFCGLAAGYVRTLLDPRIREPGDVRSSLRTPFLGQLPPLPTTPRVLDGCTPYLLESVRIVRTALLERFGETKKGVVLVTSAASDSGKTTVAALLGNSLAALGKKTLLVEADLRRPSLALRLGIRANGGLAAFLRGDVPERDVAVSTDVPRLDLVPAGSDTEDFDPEQLCGERLATAFGRWRKAYDFVVVDSPPVLPVADARILAPLTDGTIMVLRSSHTRRMDLAQAFSDLSTGGGRLLGTVLVGVRPRGGYSGDTGYYGYARKPLALEAVPT
jgi:receptor protein-tyrosine kinase